LVGEGVGTWQEHKRPVGITPITLHHNKLIST
jgi:hypothetical protein